MLAMPRNGTVSTTHRTMTGRTWGICLLGMRLLLLGRGSRYKNPIMTEFGILSKGQGIFLTGGLQDGRVMPRKVSRLLREYFSLLPAKPVR